MTVSTELFSAKIFVPVTILLDSLFYLFRITSLDSVSILKRYPPAVETLKKPSSADMKSRMNRLLAVSLIALMGYMTLIFYLSSQPADVPAGVEILGIPRIILHVAEYAVLGLLTNSVMMQVSSKVSRSVFFSSVFSSLYGVTDEIHQFFVPTRCFDIYDILADTVGGIAGAVFLMILLTIMKVEKTRSQEIRGNEAFPG